MKSFKHIYVEEEIETHLISKSILEKFPDAEIIKIKNYKHIFNRSNQDFVAQKSGMKLILAKKKDNFLYKGSDYSNDFGYEKFYYNTLILNCLYNCDYCYLQGMFQSANIVIFVNQEDFFLETRKALENEKIYLCISYETDLLAFESITGFTENWINFSREFENLKIEIRTKSNDFKLISHLEPSKNIILAWTVSPESIIKKYEKNTPTLNRRLESIEQAIQNNWNVRLCLDPILHIEDWKNEYGKLIETIFEKLSTEKLYDISIGTFRISKDFLKKMKKIRTDSDILFYPFQIEKDTASYKIEKKNEILDFIKNKLIQKVSEEKIYLS